MYRNPDIPIELTSPSPEFARSSQRIGLFWWYWDHVQKQLSLSPDMIRILGYKISEFDPSSLDIFERIHPDDVEVNKEKITCLIYGEDDLYEMEFRVKDAAGEWQWYYNRGVAIAKDEAGKATMIGGICLDISGKFKQLMAKVDEQEKFEYLFRSSDEAMLVFEFSEDGIPVIVDANESAMNLFSRSKEDLGTPISIENQADSVIGEQGSFFKEVFEKGSSRLEHEYKMPDGSKRWMQFSGHSFSRSGKHQVVASVKDLTTGKKTEAALRESERLYKTLFDSAEDPIGLFTMDREIILVNRAFHDTFGYEFEEFMQKDWKERIHPEDRHIVVDSDEQFRERGFNEFSFRVIHKNGDILHVSSKNVFIKGDPGEKDMILSIGRDITKSLRAMQELEEARRKAEESDRLKSAFLANMSHEIRTPMNSIVGFSNLLVKPDLDVEARELYVNRITRNSEVLLALISDIIDLAKIESGQLPLVYGKQKMHALLKDIHQYAKDELQRLGKESLQIQTALHCDEMLETDLVRLTQIMKNLVNNAIKFTEKGKVEIGCVPGKTHKKVILYVKDSGIGIDPSNFEVIFDQFRQIDGSNTRKYGGTGLGLAICKNLAWMMGGKIWVESEEGKGSVFKLELPLKASRRTEKEKDTGKPSDESSDSISALRIMVVDDEHDSLELFREMLSNLGHEVSTATNGFEALQILEKQEAPDLMFMDDQMPVLSGTETMRIVKERYPAVKVVVQSAHALVGDRTRFLKEGFDAYLPKPFTPAQLDEILNH